jgi:hypothetical protein
MLDKLNRYSQQKLLGHTGRCFDLRYSFDGNLLLSASEDGTAMLWNASTRRAVAIFKHNKESEVLRAAFLNVNSDLITTCGADGRAIIWKTNQELNFNTSTNSTSNPKSDQNISEHTVQAANTDNNTKNNNSTEKKKNEKRNVQKLSVLTHGSGQIYACECLDLFSSSSLLMTAADSSVYLWDINNSTNSNPNSSSNSNTNPNSDPNPNPSSDSNLPVHTWTVNANTNASHKNEKETVSSPNFGGPRNPENQVFIFDAKVNPNNKTIIALALSDGTVRQIDVRSPIMSRFDVSKITPPSPPSSLSLPSLSALLSPPSETFTYNPNTPNPNPSPNPSPSPYNDSYSVVTLSSLSLNGLSTSPTKMARVGSSHATSVRVRIRVGLEVFILPR